MANKNPQTVKGKAVKKSPTRITIREGQPAFLLLPFGAKVAGIIHIRDNTTFSFIYRDGTIQIEVINAT